MIKKVIVVMFFVISILGVYSTSLVSVSADSLNENNLSVPSVATEMSAVNPDISVLIRNNEDKNIQPYGLGYKWKCYTCGYDSALHIVSATAITKANAHASRYGHQTTVFNA